MAETCPICGQAAVETRHGEFSMDSPPNIPGGPLAVPDSTWEECSQCGERILPPELGERLDAIRYQRLGLS